MRLVTPSNRASFDDWVATALHTPHVNRFHAIGGWSVCQRDPGDGWNVASYLSDDGSAVLGLSFDRAPRCEASLSLFCLHEERWRRALVCGRMLRALPPVLRANNVQVLHTTVAATNAESLALNRKRLGAPWGIKPEGVWDPELGRHVDQHCFRRATADL